MLEQADKAVVRDLEREDLPAVAQLFQNTFRRGIPAPPPSLVEYLREILFEHPWHDEAIRSKVYVSGRGVVQGFIGVFPGRFEFDGRPLRAAFAGSMMVERPEQNPLAGARLLRAFLAGPQDISLTETANSVALGMWQKLSLRPDVGYSLNWLRVFRPATATVRIMETRWGAAGLLKPLGSLADTMSEKAGLSVLRAPAPAGARSTGFRDASQQEFRDALLALSREYPLRPQWDDKLLDWLIGHAAQKRSFGTPSWRVGETRTGKLVGAYAYFGRPGGIAWLLQALSSPAAAGDLVDDLFSQADAQGCAGLRGAGHPWLAPELISRKTTFYGRSYYLAHARDKELLQPIRAGQALVSGLAGENWMRLIGDTFD